MKTYKNLTEVANDKKLSKELNEQILAYINKLVNKNELKELRVQWLYKRRELNKMIKIIEGLDKLGVTTPTELNSKYVQLIKEKEELEKIFTK